MFFRIFRDDRKYGNASNFAWSHALFPLFRILLIKRVVTSIVHSIFPIYSFHRFYGNAEKTAVNLLTSLPIPLPSSSEMIRKTRKLRTAFRGLTLYPFSTRVPQEPP